ISNYFDSSFTVTTSKHLQDQYIKDIPFLKPVLRVPAAIDLVGMVQRQGLATTSDVVDHFQTRLLRLPLSSEHRDVLIGFLTRELGTKEIGAAISYLEEPLRMLVHLIMSTPEYQLS
ncbi:MAG TPA: hypothetical protein EYO88_12960, partial [Alphaproteobacteria bacterium]|nr:hypothetical protein [Alphaproteobacteria bacterium]